MPFPTLPSLGPSRTIRVAEISARRVDWPRTMLTAGAAGVVGRLTLACWPALELAFFGRCAAEFAGLLSGCPVTRIEDGWLLASVTPAVVTTACSGTGYFLIMAVVLGGHFGRNARRSDLAVVLALSVATPLAIAINGLRIVAAVQASHWLNPLLPASYGPMLHLTVGVAVFLPALIATNLLCEFHGSSRNPAGH